MKKQFITGFLSGALIFGVVGALAATYTATDNPFPVKLNGNDVQIEGYNIEGSTYFKLRDIADTVGGFEVGFDNSTILLTTKSNGLIHVTTEDSKSPIYVYDSDIDGVPNSFAAGVLEGTNNPVITPTPTSIPAGNSTSSKKPYSIDTIVDADVEDFYKYCYDGNNLYYCNSDKVYKADVNNKTTTIFADVEKFVNERRNADTYGDFYVQYNGIEQIYYDSYKNNIYLLLNFNDKFCLCSVADNTIKTVAEDTGFPRIGTSLPNGNLFVYADWRPFNGDLRVSGIYSLSSKTLSKVMSDERKEKVISFNNPMFYYDGYIYFESLKTDLSAVYNLKGEEDGSDLGLGYSIASFDGENLYGLTDGDISIYSIKGNKIGSISYTEIDNRDFKPLNGKKFDSKINFDSNGNMIVYDKGTKCFRLIIKN